MKKFIFISLFLLSLFFLVSCGDQHIKTEYDTSLIDEPIFRYSEISDESYAVENAVDELKKVATGIIGSNEADGVAKWLQEHVNI